MGFLTLAKMDPVVEGNHGKNSERRVGRILCLSSLAKFDCSLYFYCYERKQSTCIIIAFRAGGVPKLELKIVI